MGTDPTPGRWRPSPLLVASAAMHVVGVAAVASTPSWWPTVLAALVADHAVVVASGLLPRCSWLGPNMRRLPPEAAARGEVGLTFDDGPDPDVTPAVLDLLDRHGVTASFFVIGSLVERHPELAAETAARGHTLENHTFSHPHHFFFFPPAALGREIDHAQAVITAVAGRPPHYLRAPAGIRGPQLEPMLVHRGLRLASWTRRAFDTVAHDPRKVTARLLAEIAGGDVLLLHDGNLRHDPGGRTVLLPALAAVLEGLAARGLRPVALPRPDQPDVAAVSAV